MVLVLFSVCSVLGFGVLGWFRVCGLGFGFGLGLGWYTPGLAGFDVFVGFSLPRGGFSNDCWFVVWYCCFLVAGFAILVTFGFFCLNCGFDTGDCRVD